MPPAPWPIVAAWLLLVQAILPQTHMLGPWLADLRHRLEQIFATRLVRGPRSTTAFIPDPAGRRRPPPARNPARSRRKPAWVGPALVRLHAEHPELGCRKLADTFNRRYTAATGVRVGKTYVNDVLREHAYTALCQQQTLKNRIPFDPPHNHT